MLELYGLQKRYGDRVALDGVTFAVRPGELYGFVGTNGAGKTTTMRITLGVLEADAGTVRWNGRPADGDVRRTFGYMPEARGLYPKMRVRDHLRYLAELHGLTRDDASKAADYWMERLSVAERANDRVEALSLGNQQRVQLAAALVHHPAALVLDEPFSGLDPVGVDALAEVLREQSAKGVPVVFSSHQLDLVERLCDSVGIIKQGRIQVSGTVDELRASRSERLLRVGTSASAGWADALSGVVSVEYRADAAILTLTRDADEQVVLDAARALGPVREFTPLEPSLADLFREAVAEPVPGESSSSDASADPPAGAGSAVSARTAASTEADAEAADAEGAVA